MMRMLLWPLRFLFPRIAQRMAIRSAIRYARRIPTELAPFIAQLERLTVAPSVDTESRPAPSPTSAASTGTPSTR